MAQITRVQVRKMVVLILSTAILVTVCVSLRPVYIAERKRTDNIRLFAAIRRRDTTAVRSLLDGCADANARELPTDHRAFWRRCLDFLRGEHAVTAADAYTPLQVAFQYEEDPQERSVLTEPMEIVRALIEHGANVNEKNEYGVPVVSLANTWSHDNHAFACVELLLAHGADVNAETRNGQSLLYVAILSGDMRTTDLLLKRGARCAMYGDTVSVIGLARYAEACPEMFALLRHYKREK